MTLFSTKWQCCIYKNTQGHNLGTNANVAFIRKYDDVIERQEREIRFPTLKISFQSLAKN